MTAFNAASMQNLLKKNRLLYNPKRLLSSNIPVPNKPSPPPPPPPVSDDGSDVGQRGSTGYRTVTGSEVGSTQRSETAEPFWYEERT